jgi:hypothetical protein
MRLLALRRPSRKGSNSVLISPRILAATFRLHRMSWSHIACLFVIPHPSIHGLPCVGFKTALQDRNMEQLDITLRRQSR